jgi:endonuclease YncB( thermonuclease family)
LVFGKIVNIEPVTKDKHGRVVANVFIEGKNVNQEIVKNGFAWWYRKYATDYKKLEKIEEEGKRKKTWGLWQDPEPIPPWEFRKKKEKRNK